MSRTSPGVDRFDRWYGRGGAAAAPGRNPRHAAGPPALAMFPALIANSRPAPPGSHTLSHSGRRLAVGTASATYDAARKSSRSRVPEQGAGRVPVPPRREDPAPSGWGRGGVRRGAARPIRHHIKRRRAFPRLNRNQLNLNLMKLASCFISPWGLLRRGGKVSARSGTPPRPAPPCPALVVGGGELTRTEVFWCPRYWS